MTYNYYSLMKMNCDSSRESYAFKIIKIKGDIDVYDFLTKLYFKYRLKGDVNLHEDDYFKNYRQLMHALDSIIDKNEFNLVTYDMVYKWLIDDCKETKFDQVYIKKHELELLSGNAKKYIFCSIVHIDSKFPKLCNVIHILKVDKEIDIFDYMTQQYLNHCTGDNTNDKFNKIFETLDDIKKRNKEIDYDDRNIIYNLLKSGCSEINKKSLYNTNRIYINRPGLTIVNENLDVDTDSIEIPKKKKIEGVYYDPTLSNTDNEVIHQIKNQGKTFQEFLAKSGYGIKKN
jgi:hypothetical protein